MYILKIALSSNGDKRLQTYDRITTYPYRTNAPKVCKTVSFSKLIIKCLILMIIPTKTKQSIIQTGHTFQITHTYCILIVGGSGSGKTNVLLNLINNQLDIDKIYM